MAQVSEFERRERRKFTVSEYLHLENGSETKNELIDGEIFSMTGGSLDHNRISGNLFGFLRDSAGVECEAFMSDVRLHVAKHGLVTYPDVILVCGGLKTLENRSETLTDATLVAEVLSPSTESYDRGLKSKFYRALPGLKDLLVISQDRYFVEHYSRKSKHSWTLSELESDSESLALLSIDSPLSLKTLYSKVSWTA